MATRGGSQRCTVNGSCRRRASEGASVSSATTTTTTTQLLFGVTDCTGPLRPFQKYFRSIVRPQCATADAAGRSLLFARRRPGGQPRRCAVLCVYTSAHSLRPPFPQPRAVIHREESGPRRACRRIPHRWTSIALGFRISRCSRTIHPVDILPVTPLGSHTRMSERRGGI